MDTYIFQAALWCETCIYYVKQRLDSEGKRPNGYLDETSYDSDEYPKGPYPSSESDYPAYCDGCGLFMENPLTQDGIDYVRDAIGDSGILTEWYDFYSEVLES